MCCRADLYGTVFADFKMSSKTIFGVPPLAGSAREPAGPASSGVFFLVLQVLESCLPRELSAACFKGNMLNQNGLDTSRSVTTLNEGD